MEAAPRGLVSFLTNQTGVGTGAFPSTAVGGFGAEQNSLGFQHCERVCEKLQGDLRTRWMYPPEPGGGGVVGTVSAPGPVQISLHLKLVGTGTQWPLLTSVALCPIGGANADITHHPFELHRSENWIPTRFPK